VCGASLLSPDEAEHRYRVRPVSAAKGKPRPLRGWREPVVPRRRKPWAARTELAKKPDLQKHPARLFNSSLDGNARRAIDIHEGEEVDESAFKKVVKLTFSKGASLEERRRGSSPLTAFREAKFFLVRDGGRNCRTRDLIMNE